MVVRATLGDGERFTVARLVVEYQNDFDYFSFTNEYTGRGGTFGFSGFGPSFLDREYDYALPPAVAVANGMQATLAYNVDGLWQDMRQFHVVVQALNNDSTVPSTSQSMYAQVTPDATFAAALTRAGVATTAYRQTCTTSTSEGMCTIVLNLPQAWFTTDILHHNLSVAFGYADGRIAPQTAGEVSVHRYPSITGSRMVVLELPMRGKCVLSNNLTGNVGPVRYGYMSERCVSFGSSSDSVSCLGFRE